MITESAENQMSQITTQITQASVRVTAQGGAVTAKAIAQALTTAITALNEHADAIKQGSQVRITQLYRQTPSGVKNTFINSTQIRNLVANYLNKLGVTFSIEKHLDGGYLLHFAGKDRAAIKYAISHTAARLNNGITPLRSVWETVQAKILHIQAAGRVFPRAR